MTKLWLPGAAFIVSLVGLAASEQTPLPSPARSLKLAPYKERLAAAKSVKVETSLLGIEIDSFLEAARAKLDPLRDPTKPVLKAESEAGEGEHKMVWQLAKTDFASVYLKTADKERITYIQGTLRGGKEIPFDKIGQVEKAPILRHCGSVGCRAAGSKASTRGGPRHEREGKFDYDLRRKETDDRSVRMTKL